MLSTLKHTCKHELGSCWEGMYLVWGLHAGGWLRLVWCAPLAVVGLLVRSLPRTHAVHGASAPCCPAGAAL